MTITNLSLQSLPDPTIINGQDFEAILAELKADILGYAPELEDALALESEPVAKLAQAFAYRIMHERKLANDQALSLMLAKAFGSQLDNLGALPFINTFRKTLIEADPSQIPPLAAVYESDEEYRARIQLALEGYTTAGSEGAYKFHALAAHADVEDVGILAPNFQRVQLAGLPDGVIALRCENAVGLDDPLPGDVAVTLLKRQESTTPSEDIQAAVEQALNKEKIRPLTDRPRVTFAQFVSYQVQAKLWFYPGPDSGLLIDEAQAQTQSYVNKRRAIGHDVSISGLHAALHRQGVQRVELVQPIADIAINDYQSAHCTGISISNMGVAV